MRLITKSNFRCPSKPLFLRLKLLPFDELVSLNSLIFMFKLQLCPQVCLLKDLFASNAQMHDYNTRQRNLFHQPRVRTFVSSNSFRIFCIKEWNKLPLDIRNSTTLSRFKTLCQTMLFKNIK